MTKLKWEKKTILTRLNQSLYFCLTRQPYSHRFLKRRQVSNLRNNEFRLVNYVLFVSCLKKRIVLKNSFENKHRTTVTWFFVEEQLSRIFKRTPVFSGIFWVVSNYVLNIMLKQMYEWTSSIQTLTKEIKSNLWLQNAVFTEFQLGINKKNWD